MRRSSSAQAAPQPPSTRERLVRETAALLERRGYQATGIKDIVRAAGVTTSSLYHHFPRGKEELAASALVHAGERFADLLRTALARGADAPDAIAACADDLAADLASTGWAEGCPVAVTALESVNDAPLLRVTCARILQEWQDLIATRLQSAGIGSRTAAELACMVLSGLEGAELLSRVAADPTPLHTTGRHLARLVAAEIAADLR
ncbi:TetR/AcrR family transcriptional regulator [Pseudonocardia kunmingensis]|uniref:TetR/AcrR family transcriptional regulator n=1 Tax=Pseudonocardia kunmingensis TaxID=630975 RepID=UPI001478E189|nr:TetR/AcrR family transcriptional regulator [Pseudonocardia kunmingensis]